MTQDEDTVIPAARNLGEYEGLLDIDELLVVELVKATQAVANAL